MLLWWSALILSILQRWSSQRRGRATQLVRAEVTWSSLDQKTDPILTVPVTRTADGFMSRIQNVLGLRISGVDHRSGSGSGWFRTSRSSRLVRITS